MISMKERGEIFRKGVATFKKSEQTADDYLVFIQKAHQCLKQGTGFVWSEIKEILDKEL